MMPTPPRTCYTSWVTSESGLEIAAIVSARPPVIAENLVCAAIIGIILAGFDSHTTQSQGLNRNTKRRFGGPRPKKNGSSFEC